MAQLTETSRRREAEEDARAMAVRCSICLERFRELEQSAGIGVPRTLAQALQENYAPDPKMLRVHHDERHENEIKQIAPKRGLRYVRGYT
jgi:hypothetical protein